MNAITVDIDHSYTISAVNPDNPEDAESMLHTYFDVGYNDDGWYLSVVYDSGTDTGSLVDDDGPYDIAEAAICAGMDRSSEWFLVHGYFSPYYICFNLHDKIPADGATYTTDEDTTHA